MSKKDKPDGEEPKKKGKLKLILSAVVLIAAGAGAAFGAAQMGYLGGHEAETGPDLPELVRKGEVDPYAPPSDDKDDGAAEVDGEGGSEYRTSYYSFEETFTSNLKESPALVQVSLAASTRRDGRVLMWMKKHDLALRSAILIVLADTPEDEVYTVEGKQRLQKRLTGAINDVLTEREGFGGVDSIYFRGFLVQ